MKLLERSPLDKEELANPGRPVQVKRLAQGHADMRSGGGRDRNRRVQIHSGQRRVDLLKRRRLPVSVVASAILLRLGLPPPGRGTGQAGEEGHRMVATLLSLMAR